jgi:hypothetical protein
MRRSPASGSEYSRLEAIAVKYRATYRSSKHPQAHEKIIVCSSARAFSCDFERLRRPGKIR